MISLHTGTAFKNEKSLLGPRLKAVSRSFYLSLRILPSRMRRSLSLAYLLARTADTIADSWSGDTSERKNLLVRFRDALEEASAGKEVHLQLPPQPSRLPVSEKLLMEKCDLALNLFAATNPAAKKLIKKVLLTLTEGMLFDFDHFPQDSPDQHKALKTASELDLYTYLVAGTVGEFWTDMGIHAGYYDRRKREKLVEWGIRFGKGLQLINILRDVTGDYKNGRVYLPLEELNRISLTPEDIGNPENFPELRDLYRCHLALACGHLSCGQKYIMATPRLTPRLRLASIWPLWIGLSTLKRLAGCPNPLSAPPVRIPQKETYMLLGLSLVCVQSNFLLQKVYAKLSAQIPSK